MASYYNVEYQTTTQLKGLDLTWTLETRPIGGFDDPDLMEGKGAFVKSAHFDTYKAFKPREATPEARPSKIRKRV